MIKFKLESSSTEPGVNTGWVPNTVDGHASIKASVEEVIFRNGSAVSVAVKADPEFSDEELVNLVALSSKCWHHLAFMAGLKIGSQDRVGFISQLANPWSALKRGLEENDSFSVFDALDSTRLGTRAVLAGRDRVVTFELFRNAQSPVGVMAAAWRLANMAEWTLKFTQELRLTSNTKLKWETFNAITAHVLRGIEPSIQARGQERLSMEQLVERARRLTPAPRGALAAQVLSVQDLVDGQEYRLRLGRIRDTGQQGPDWEAWQQCSLRLQRSEEGVTSLTPPRPGWPTYDPRRDFIPQAEETAVRHRLLDWARQSAIPYSLHGLFLVEDYCMQIEGVICLTTPAVSILTGVTHE